MKKIVVIFLCFFASSAFASSADSGKCPWPVPFTFSIHAVGIENDFTRYNDSITSNATWDTTEDLNITVDTISSFSFVGNPDDLEFFQLQSQGHPPQPPITLLIEFDSGTNSIKNLTVYQNQVVHYQPDFFGSYNYYFTISSLYFDSASIFVTDSSFKGHNISISRSVVDSQTDYVGSSNQTFTASSVTLSGIFRPTTFSNPPAIVTEVPQPNNLTIYSSNGSIACSFDVSDDSRDLEIFSPLGIREATFAIPAGQTGASLPHLSAGFYFVRMGGALAKICVTE